MGNGLSHYNIVIIFELYNFVQMTFYHQCDQLCDTFIYLNQYVWHDILNMELFYFFKRPFVSWFRILLQYDANIVFLLCFSMVMQYPFKFQKICYKTLRILGYPRKGIACALSISNH
jgi:hypothetical protein